MKTVSTNSKRRAGSMLIECMMYIVICSVLLAISFEAFYKCWDNSEALGYAGDDVVKAMHAGELWREDVRSATGKILVTTDTNGQAFRIPHGKAAIIYTFNTGELRRKNGANESVVLGTIKTSRMEITKRTQTSACVWELEMTPHNAKARMPLLFTFIAAGPQMP